MCALPRLRLLARCLLVLIGLTFGAKGSAQSSIVLDGSLPNGRTDDVTATQAGPTYEVGEALGWQVGGNLFHSFSSFSVGAGDTATFTEDPALNAGLPPISNVISRVTGGDVSAINGVLRSEIPNSHFFLLNPAGVIFGGTSSLDLPGSLTVSTAQSLVYEGGAGALSTTIAADPVLLAAEPVAFGFLGDAPAADVLFGNPLPDTARELTVAEGATFTAIGGNVHVINNTDLQAFGGRIQVAAVGSATTDVPADLADWSVAPDGDPELGEVRIENQSALNTIPFDPNAPQGTVVIRGGRFALVNGAVVSGGDRIGGTGAAVDVQVARDVEIRDRSQISSEGSGAIESGGVRISAVEIALAEQATVRSRVFGLAPGSAPGGDIALEASRIRAESGSLIETTSPFGTSDTGDIRIVTDALSLRDASISATNQAASGGDIVIEGGEIEIENGTVQAIGSAGSSVGSIRVTGTSLRVRGGGAEVVTSNRHATDTARAGDLDVEVSGVVSIESGALLGTESTGVGDGGNLRIDAARIDIAGEGMNGGDLRPTSVQAGALGSGNGGNVTLVADDVQLSGGASQEFAGIAQAFVAPGASGDGGDLSVTTGRLEARDGAQLSTLSQGSGSAGSIDVLAREEVLLTGDTRIAGVATPAGLFSRSEGNGNGGDVRVEAPGIRIENGAEISARALGAGSSGDVFLDAANLVRVSGVGEQVSVVTARGLDGPGGDINVNAGRLEVTNGAVMDVSTSGVGEGGTLAIRAGSVFVGGVGAGFPARLGAQADATGNAGGIEIDAGSTEIGVGGQVTALSRGVGGNPGDIRITSGTVTVRGEVTAESFAGAGGSVALIGDTLVIDGGRVSARSIDAGDAGNIRLHARTLVARNAQITTDSNAFGGNIEVIAGQLVNLQNTIISANSRGGANALGQSGGNIFIDPPAVIINQSTITANGFGNANGGNILLVGNPLLISGDSLISASSQFGTQGTVSVSSPNAEITGELAALPEDFLDASALLAEACLARDDTSGSFAVRTTPVLRPAPDDLLGPESGGVCESR